jgi:hypothetical protein
MNRGRVGEERGGKETDGCPLTVFSLVFGMLQANLAYRDEIEIFLCAIKASNALIFTSSTHNAQVVHSGC